MTKKYGSGQAGETCLRPLRGSCAFGGSEGAGARERRGSAAQEWTDVHTQRTLTQAAWNKSQRNVRHITLEIEAVLAFPILRFDSDNGSEFLNWHLADYFLKRSKPAAFTRSSPYHKNGNARVEQKN